MKKIKFIIQSALMLVLLSVAFVSCEKDFNSLGSGIIGDNNFETASVIYPVVSYNKVIGPVQSSGLPDNLLGFHHDPVFGDFTSNIVAQLDAAVYDPDFGYNITLDSVSLTMPYYSTIIDTDTEGNQTYELDSVFGETPIKLSIFRNDYFLSNFNPESEFSDTQKYFSDRSISDGTFIDPLLLEGELLFEDDAFLPDDQPIEITTVTFNNETNETTETMSNLPPSIRVLFDDLQFWEDLIIAKEGEPELSNSNNFQNYFRGLYIKTEATDADGTLMLLNLATTQAQLELHYTTQKVSNSDDDDMDGVPNFADPDFFIDAGNPDDDPIDDSSELDSDNDGINDETDVDLAENGEDLNNDGIDDNYLKRQETFTMNFSGSRVNFFENNLNPIPAGNEVTGDEKLYLKGAEGSMAILNLFNRDEDGNSLEFDQFINDFRQSVNGDYVTGNNGEFLTRRLINEANLIFHVDETVMQEEEPERIFIYDLDNNNVLIDYAIDQSADDTQIGAKIDHLHPLETTSEGKQYKIEITEHLNNMLLRDSTNTRLGVLVIGNIQAVERFDLLEEDGVAESVISGTILTPRGTVLYGNNTALENKRLQLEIIYTCISEDADCLED